MSDFALAARYLVTLHAIEQAYWSGNTEDLYPLIASVDPVEVWELAEELANEAKRQSQVTIAEAAA